MQILSSNKAAEIETTIPILGRVRISLRTPAVDVFALYKQLGETERQKKIQHLGLIANVLEGSSHTRWDYLLLQLAAVEIVNSFHKGSLEISLGALSVNGENIEGSELLKSWFMLSNMGHMTKTIADEKAILSKCVDDKVYKKHVLKTVRDRELTDFIRTCIAAYRYVSFHYGLTAYRLYTELPPYSRQRNRYLALLRLLLLPEDKLPVDNKHKLAQLRNIYYLIRRLCIIALDSRNSHLPIDFDFASALIGMSSTEARFQGKSVMPALEPVLGWLADEVYLDPDVMASVRGYELKAEEQLSASTPAECLKRAIHEGIIPDYTTGPLRHVYRRTAYGYMNWPTYWAQKAVDRRLGLHPDFDVSVDQNPYTKKRYVDIHSQGQLLSKEQLRKLVQALLRDSARVQEGLSESHNNRIGVIERSLTRSLSGRLSSEEIDQIGLTIGKALLNARERVEQHDILVGYFKSILWLVLNSIFPEPFELRTGPKRDELRYYAMRDSALELDNIETTILRLIRRSSGSDVGRQNELKLTRRLCQRVDAEHMIVCFDRIHVIDRSASPAKRLVTDIDGMVISQKAGTVKLHLLEGKSTTHPYRDARKDLEKLRKLIHKNFASGFRITKAYGLGARLVITL